MNANQIIYFDSKSQETQNTVLQKEIFFQIYSQIFRSQKFSFLLAGNNKLNKIVKNFNIQRLLLDPPPKKKGLVTFPFRSLINKAVMF